MKRSHQQSQTDLIMKEAKLEVEDNPDDFKSANRLDLFGKVPKEERISPEPVLKKVIKKEVPDGEEYNFNSHIATDVTRIECMDSAVKEENFEDSFQWSEVKAEPTQLTKDEPESESFEPLSETQSALIWRPNINSLSAFTSLDDDFDDCELDLSLGSSILFGNQPERYLEVPEEKRRRSITPINFDDESDPNFRENHKSLMPKKTLSSIRIKNILSDSFNKNPHPNAMEMIKISESCGVRYRTVFDDFESKRASEKTTCEKDDACDKIRSFFLRDGENMYYNRISDKVRRILEDEIETHLLSRKRFSLGYIHVIMEKTDLPPAYIRGQYESYKKKMFSKDNDEYIHRTGCEDPNSLPMDILRKLEDAYLTKKYHCEEKEWSPKDFKSLAAQLQIGEQTVTAWMDKRKNAMLGLTLTNETVELREERLAGIKAPDGRKLPSQTTESLNAEYDRDHRPSLARRVIIAKTLNLTEMQVRNFFNKKRIQTRRHAEWETARQDVMTMPREKVQIMEKIAAERRKSGADYMREAKKIGVAYMTLISFVNWRKSVVKASKLNNSKYQSSTNHKY